jgi:hypothetical protein
MTPYEQAKELREKSLPLLSARKSDLKRILEKGPAAESDYKLLVSALAFTLAEISVWEGERLRDSSDN